MAAKKARKTKKAPSKALGRRWAVKQGTSRAVVRGADYAAARARARAIGFPDPDSIVLIDEKKRNGKTAKKATAKRKSNRTIIKAKRVTILNLTKKKNPPRKANITSASDLQYAGTAKKVTQDGVKGWMLGSKFFPGSATTKAQKITASAYLDLRTGDVWKRKAKGNPKKKRNALDYSPETPIEVMKHYRSGGPGYETKRQRVIRLGQRDLFAPEASIDELMGYLRKSNPSVITAVKRKMGAKAFAKASPSVLKREMKAVLRAELAKRKPAKKAAKKRAVAKGKRRNPDTPAQLLNEFRGYPKDKDSTLYFAEGTPTGLYKLGSLYQIKLANGTKIKPTAGKVWLCADTKGKLYLGTTDSKQVLAHAPQGSLGKVSQVEYIARKPHLGDNQVTRYYHNLGEETGEKPTLYSDGKGGLLFKGGATYIRSDGIHN